MNEGPNRPIGKPVTPQPATFDERFIEAFENVPEMRSDIRHIDAGRLDLEDRRDELEVRRVRPESGRVRIESRRLDPENRRVRAQIRRV